MNTQTLKMDQVTGPVSYIAQWQKEERSYDPRVEGWFAVVNLTGKEIGLGISEQGYPQRLSLSYGSVGVPRATLDQAVADFALTVAKFPVAEARLSIVKLPCVFSTRDGWVAIDFSVPEEVKRDACEAADKDKRYADHFFGAQFERKYRLR